MSVEWLILSRFTEETKMSVEIFGSLDSGLQISALMPRHLAGSKHPWNQTIILTVGDSRELAKKIAEMQDEDEDHHG